VLFTRVFVDKKFRAFKNKKKVRFLAMTKYYEDLKAPIAFSLIRLKDTLGETISKNKLRQFRLAETQKWAHVTFFFNGLLDESFKKEERFLVPSLKVSTFDKAPGMSAKKIGKEAIKRLKSNKYQFMMINFANPDMLGHTGKFKETVEAIKIVDEVLKNLIPVAQKNNYTILITADHGNSERMRDKKGRPDKAHTTNKVPLVIITDKKIRLKTGALYNVAPTALKLMNLKIPKIMSKPLF